MPIGIWGKASAGEIIRVTLGSPAAMATASISVTAAADGAWQAMLPAMAAGGPFTLTVVGVKQTVTINDVMIGEVWLCAGQSNMEFQLSRVADATQEIADSEYPDLRLTTISTAASLSEEVTARLVPWQVSAPASAPNFSAVCFLMGRTIQKQLKVPVGLIAATWGGTTAEAWTSASALAAIEDFRDALALVESKKPVTQTDPTLLYNGMINPLIRFRLRGVAWYQGESNVARGYQYGRLLPTMITDWRKRFALDLPFALVQLPNNGNAQTVPVESAPWAILRENQAAAADGVAPVTMVVTIDTGAINAALPSPVDLHPVNKADVGNRLGRSVLEAFYAQPGPRSPIYDHFAIEGKTIRVFFRALAANENLMVGKKIAVDPVTADPTGVPAGFAIAGADKKWVAAGAVIDGATIVVSAATVAAPAAVRYGWAADPPVNLYGQGGMPVTPFRTDRDYGVMISGGSGAGISALGEGVFNQGAKVAIKATVPVGKAFDRWVGDTTVLSNPAAAESTLSMPASYVSLRALFK
ncbi:MAG TPA: sialate O-acetylesterase [Polyangia bacterium]